MAKERDELLNHSYDGIREYNNPLPGWWLWLFYGTILFAIVYIPWHFFGYGQTGPQEYQEEVAEAAKAAPAASVAGAPQPSGAQPSAAQPGGRSAAGSAPVAPPKDAATLAAGKAIFTANCAPCHGPQGQGVIGPNLADEFWLHGDSFEEIQNTIANGIPDKGMIAWRATLGPEKIRQVAAYVVSLSGSNPPNPKPPQGTRHKD